MSREDTGAVRMQWGTQRLASELGYSYRTIKYGRRRLVELGLVEIVRAGLGSDRSLYRVAVERLQPVSEDDLAAGEAVHPGENPSPEETDPGQRLPHPGATVAPPRGNGCPTYTRARGSSSDPSKDPPNPPPAPPAGGESSPTIKCPAARRRGRACANCRACGTTPRQIAAAAVAAARLAEVEARKAEQLARRRADEEAKAAVAAAAAARAASSGRTRYEEWAIEQHLHDVADVEKSINERETG